MSNSFKQASKKFEQSKRLDYPFIPGVLGFMVNGKETVENTNRPGYVYVRLRGVANEVIQAFNDIVSPIYNLPVLVIRDDIDNTRYRVYARDTGAYVNWGTASSYLPLHGDSHSFADKYGTGGDIVWVYGKQMMPLNVVPSGTSVWIEPGVYYQAGQWRSAGNVGVSNLLPAKPSAGNARIMLVYLDENGNPGLATGTTFSESISGTSSLVPYLPNISNNYYVPLAGVRLTSATNLIAWGDITDLRPWIVGDGFIPTGTFAPNSASYITIGNETGLTAERRFTAGAGISITDNGANSTVVIAFTGTVGAGSSTPTYPAIYDDNTYVTTGTALHFNNNLSVASTGTSVWIDGQAEAASSIPTYPAIYDDGVFKTTGTALVYGNNLSVVYTGTTAFIDASSSSSSNTMLLYDDDVFKITGTAIHFNDNLSVIVSGTSVWIDGSASGNSGGADLLIYDGDIFKATGTSLHFNDNLSVVVTGSAVFIDATGVTGSAGTPGLPGSNTILLYEDSTFKTTGSSIVFGSNLDVAVTGSTAFVSSTGGGSGGIVQSILYSGTSNQTIATASGIVDVTNVTGSYTQETGYLYKTIIQFVFTKTTNGNIFVYFTDFSNNLVGQAILSIANGNAATFYATFMEIPSSTQTVSRKIRASTNTGSVEIYKNIYSFIYLVEKIPIL